MSPTVNAVHLAAAVVVIASAGTASAEKLVRYRFNADGTNLAAQTWDHPLSAPDLVFGSGASQAVGDFGNRLGLDTFMSAGESTALADALANDSFIEFGTTSDPGWSIDLNKLKFRISGYDPEGDFTPPTVAWSLRSSLDDFSADIDTGTNSVEFQDYEVEKFKFHQLGLDVDTLETVSFRLYFAHWGTGIPTGVVVDQIVMLGQTNPAVPGPGGLMALASVGLARGRRRR